MFTFDGLNALKVYKSSAGSGKTFTLVLEYLKLLLHRSEDYKAILAITFTNKAAGEMKTRVVEALVSLSSGSPGSLMELLNKELPGIDIPARAQVSLKNILHDYSSFSILTIDSFFQKILRSLAREIHLPLNMEVEVELDNAIMDATESLLRDVGIDKELTEWLTNLALQKLDDDKGWKIEADIASVAGELFSEGMQNSTPLSREEILKFYKELISIRRIFETQMREFGQQGIRIMNEYSLEVTDFSYGTKGAAGYFLKIQHPDDKTNYKFTSRTEEASENPGKWATAKSSRRQDIITAAEQSLVPLLTKIRNYLDAEYRKYVTACEVLKKIYLFGIVNDLQRKFSEYRKENNLILLSDTNRLLGEIISDHDAPFVYEKTGNRYKHLLIDEFQDTSYRQWKNLLPLVVNALGSGFMTLVVGDAKQSIYRWRGGNMNLLLRDLSNDLSDFKSLLQENSLATNYRSRKAVVEFNNNFFFEGGKLLNAGLEMKDFPPLQLAYSEELRQQIQKEKNSGGYIRVEFVANEETEDGEKTAWKDQALENLFLHIEKVKENKYNYRDICILVRRNADGNRVANFLFDKGVKQIISPDSLLISSAPQINFLVSVFRFLSDQSDSIARSLVLYYYCMNISPDKITDLHEIFSDFKSVSRVKKSNATQHSMFEGIDSNLFNRYLPESFTAHLSYLSKLPVYELGEQLVKIFSLNEKPDAYIQRFQDLLLEYSTQSDSSLDGFLDWWDNSGKAQNCSVIVPETMDAIRIMTIHASKGLQFPVVFMPFSEWSLFPKSGELMWMSTEEHPFAELGKVPVTAGKALLDSYFSDEYSEEVNQSVIDNLNLLYVGFTRAEDKLFVYCPVDNNGELNNVSKLISRTCTLIGTVNEGVFEMGSNDLKYPDKKETVTSESFPLTSYPSNRWQEKLSLTTHSGDLLSLFDKTKSEKINYGILMHAVLASIKDVGELEDAVSAIVFEGLIGNDEREKVIRELKDLINRSEIKPFFEPGYTVMAEREIIVPGGEVFRPDRVLLKDGKAIVIDFKTGKRDKKHEAQVSGYAGLLNGMKYKEVESYLVYLSEPAVVKVG